MKKSVKKMRTAIISAFLIISFFVASTPINVAAKAEDITAKNTVPLQSQSLLDDSDKYTINQAVNEMLGNVNIKSCEYLYNLDDSPDYIYVEFDNAGYAVFLKETMELLEYSKEGNLDYSQSPSAKYYAGPGIYLLKEDDCFVDTLSQKSLYITKESAKEYANGAREMLLSNSRARLDQTKVEFDYSLLETDITEFPKIETQTTTIPSIGDYDLPGTESETYLDGTYIPNYRYFVIGPKHGKNSTGTCGAVAAQLLLSYHNYYSDRRIIANNFLNGSASVSLSGQDNPNFCADPMSMTPNTLGTRGHEEDGSDDPNSYFHYILDHLEFEAVGQSEEGEESNQSPYAAGIRTEKLTEGIIDILAARNLDIAYTVNYHPILVTNNNYSSVVIDELDSGRPLILLLQQDLGASNHYVVAYGYGYYTYPGTTLSYPGYITHFGYLDNGGTSYKNIWVNARWCSQAITLKIDHNHQYLYIGRIGMTSRNEYKCNICDHRTDAAIVVEEGETYTKGRAPLQQNGYNYKDYYVTFETTGSMLFMTFGSADTQLYLFDTENNQLAFDDNDGYGYNAMLHYMVTANTPYILRVRFCSDNTSGNIEFAMTPASYECDEYIDIEQMTGTGEAWSLDLYLNTTFILAFTPSAEGTYRIRIVPEDDIGNALTVIDISSGARLITVNDPANPQIWTTPALVAETPYLIVISTDDITQEEGFVDLYVQKTT